MKRLFFLLLIFFNNFSSFAQLVRGPYLQVVTPTSIIIRWKTQQLEDSKVFFGTNGTNLNDAKIELIPTFDHEIKLSNLQPNTKYYYSIGSSTRTLQGDLDNYFLTAPVVGSTQKIRFLALGDCGYTTPSQIAVREQSIKFMKANPTPLLILLGDNAYEYGTDANFQDGFFNAYQGNILKNMALYPATGNHEYGNRGDLQASRKVAYFDIFTMPQQGEAGGVPSNSEGYYSYNYGNIHFIVLDSYGKEDDQRFYDTLSKQVTWLKKDLAANKQRWTIAYWHHPPYSMGSHNSDTEEELILCRQNLLRIIETAGVDVVLCGHSHTYERSPLLRNHYGKADTYRAKLHSMSRSSGKYDGTTNSCPFIKNERGTVYVVAGTAAVVVPSKSQATFPHKAMLYSNDQNSGSLIVEVEDNRLDAKWLCEDGVIRDNFTLMKNVNKKAEISINEGSNLTLRASWKGDYGWNNGENNQSITLSNITATTKYFVNDKQKCLVDSFLVTVKPKTSSLEIKATVFPNPTEVNSISLAYEIPENGRYQVQFFDDNGNLLTQIFEDFYEKGSYTKTISLSEKLAPNKIVYLKINSVNLSENKNYQLTKRILMP